MHLQESCPVCKVIASTSSAMAPEDLCAGLDCANKIVVTHPFNPPHLVPFVEMVKSPCTSEEAAQVAYDVLEDCGRKVCVMKKSAPGFIANRLQHALLREALYMAEEGLADPRNIDKALMYSFMPRYTSVGLFEHQMRQGWIWFRISKITCSRPCVTERRRLTLLTTGWPATAGDRKTVWEFTSGMQSPSPISRRGHLNLIGSISTGIFPKTEKVLPEI